MKPEAGSRWRLNALDPRAVQVIEVHEVLPAWRVMGSELAGEGGRDPNRPNAARVEVVDGFGIGEVQLWPLAIFDDAAMCSPVGKADESQPAEG